MNQNILWVHEDKAGGLEIVMVVAVKKRTTSDVSEKRNRMARTIQIKRCLVYRNEEKYKRIMNKGSGHRIKRFTWQCVA